MDISNKKRNEIQTKARSLWKQAGSNGLLAMATGTGKSKIAVDEAKEKHQDRGQAFKAILIVPTEKLRDVNWKKEFEKWNALDTWGALDRECYASIAKIKGNTYDLVILDEAHYLTPANAQFFSNNKVRRVMALTATPPEDPIKQILLDSIAPIVYIYSLNQAVKDGLVAPFNIIVVESPLDSTNKVIKSGTKTRPFLQTEEAKYTYYNKQIRRLKAEDAKREEERYLALALGQSVSNTPDNSKKLSWLYLHRMRFIYNLPSKLAVAKKLMAGRMKGRYLVFAGSIEQAEKLCHPQVFHSKSSDKYYSSFLAEEIDYLGVVKAVNEGHNIPNMDMSLIVQLNSRELDVIQRIGRIVRWRLGHVETIYIIVATDTQDEVWLQKALQGFDSKHITYINSNSI